MPRNRKLYVSELLLRSLEKDTIALHIGQPNEMYFDSINEGIEYLLNTPLWNKEVEQWLQAKWRNQHSKWIPTLYIKIK